MKKLVLFTLASLIYIGGFSQSLSLIDPVNVVTGTLVEIGNGELAADWSVQNISETTIAVRARRNVIEEVTGSANYFCWGVCFGETVNVSPTSVNQTMAPGDINNTFYAHYRPNGNAGQTIIEYCFFDANNPSDQICQTVNFCVDAECIVGVEETASAGTFTNIYPNPVNGMANLTYQFISRPENAKFKVYNMVGELVKESNIATQSGMILFHSDDFNNGVYVVVLEENGQVVDTQKLIISK